MLAREADSLDRTAAQRQADAKTCAYRREDPSMIGIGEEA